MDEEKRINDDIRMFDENIAKAKAKNQKEERIMDLAKRYRVDAEYYLKKKDHVTSFGCINYAHGLLDSLIKW
ncbi:MAG: DUF357 domain-containing protein [Candidatus Micrarchaeota archaeon]